jgi:cell wall-associated NlpC family hydrolase
VCVTLALSTIAALLTAPSGSATKPPPNPTDGQISQADQEKAALAAEVGRLSAEVAQEQEQLRQLDAAAEMAEQRVAWALQKLDDAKRTATDAQAAVVSAQQRVDAAKQDYSSFVQATYMTGSIGGTTGSLLTAPDPNVLLQQDALQHYESDHQIDAIGNLDAATVAKSNADAAARAAVQKEQQLTEAAKRAQQDAEAALAAAKVKEQQLTASLAANQTSLQQAQLRLATLNHQRQAYIAYQKRQAEIRAARERAREIAEAKARAAAARERARMAREARERAREAREARERARERAAHNHNGGGSPGTSDPGNPSSPSGGSPSGGGTSNGGGIHHSNGGSHHTGGGNSTAPPSGGYWTPQAGQAAVNRAMHYLGWMYAWAGGNAYGPTFGVCAGDGAWNDCHIRGFDCSGLTLYAWAPYLSLPHFSAAQYYAAGSVHPSISSLMPGDLVFWSSNGSVSGIHHVAIYIGNGNVLQAPQSGSVIQITPVLQVSWGLFGATRPLT